MGDVCWTFSLGGSSLAIQRINLLFTFSRRWLIGLFFWWATPIGQAKALSIKVEHTPRLGLDGKFGESVVVTFSLLLCLLGLQTVMLAMLRWNIQASPKTRLLRKSYFLNSYWLSFIWLFASSRAFRPHIFMNTQNFSAMSSNLSISGGIGSSARVWN